MYLKPYSCLVLRRNTLTQAFPFCSAMNPGTYYPCAVLLQEAWLSPKAVITHAHQ